MAQPNNGNSFTKKQSKNEKQGQASEQTHLSSQGKSSNSSMGNSQKKEKTKSIEDEKKKSGDNQSHSSQSTEANKSEQQQSQPQQPKGSSDQISAQSQQSPQTNPQPSPSTSNLNESASTNATQDANSSKVDLGELENPKVNFQSFNIIKELGSGAFGKVFLGQKKDTKELFAIKALKKRNLILKKQLKYAVTECNVLKMCNHPFVLKLHYAFQVRYSGLSLPSAPRSPSIHISLTFQGERRRGIVSPEEHCSVYLACFLCFLYVCWRPYQPINPTLAIFSLSPKPDSELPVYGDRLLLRERPVLPFSEAGDI